MKKKVFHTESAYVLGILLLALGTALMEKADFGVSMVVAPAYLLYLKVSQALPFFTFGMAEYLFQAMLLVGMMCLLRQFRVSYLFSVVTAILYGFVLDGAMALIALSPWDTFAFRAVCYLAGFALCAFAIACLFYTYISPEAYELFVKRVAVKWNWDIHLVKTVYDCASCVLAIVLSFAFFGFGHFEGIKWGTILCTLFNGALISLCTRILGCLFVFRDRWPLRRYFECAKRDWANAPVPFCVYFMSLTPLFHA